MSLIKTPFNDAVVKDVSTSPTGKSADRGAKQLPSGLPQRDGGLIPEVLYDEVAPAPKFVDISKHDLKIDI